MKAREDAIRDRDAELARLEKAQTTERGRLETLEQKVRAEKAELDAKAKVLRTAQPSHSSRRGLAWR